MTATCTMVCKGLSLTVCFTVWAAALTQRGWSMFAEAIMPSVLSFLSWPPLWAWWGETGDLKRSRENGPKLTESNDWDLFQVPRKPDWPCPPPNPGYWSWHDSRQIFWPLRVRGAVPNPPGSPPDPTFLHAPAPEARCVPHHLPREHRERAAVHGRGNAQQDPHHLESPQQRGLRAWERCFVQQKVAERSSGCLWGPTASCRTLSSIWRVSLAVGTTGSMCAAASIKSTLQKPAAGREGSNPSENLAENGKSHINDSQKPRDT